MRAVCVSACFAALIAASAAMGQVRSPTEEIGAILGSRAALMPRGLKADEQVCMPATSSGCRYFGPGVLYDVREGLVEEFWIVRVDGRFNRPLPFGLTGSEDRAGVKKALTALHIKSYLDSSYAETPVFRTRAVRIHGQDRWFFFDFDRGGRLDRIRAWAHDDADY